MKKYGCYTEENGERRYSPHTCTGATKVRVKGRPKKKLVSTSFVERQNLTMRMGMRRFTFGFPRFLNGRFRNRKIFGIHNESTYHDVTMRQAP